jgi:hypothetical protein
MFGHSIFPRGRTRKNKFLLGREKEFLMGIDKLFPSSGSSIEWNGMKSSLPIPFKYLFRTISMFNLYLNGQFVLLINLRWFVSHCNNDSRTAQSSFCVSMKSPQRRYSFSIGKITAAVGFFLGSSAVVATLPSQFIVFCFFFLPRLKGKNTKLHSSSLRGQSGSSGGGPPH